MNQHDNLITDLLHERYFQPGESSWDDVAYRVGNFLGENEDEKVEFTEAIRRMEIIPNSPCLMNAGTEVPQMSACFSVGLEDSIPGIFDAVKFGAMIHKTGGGTAYNFTKLRAKGSDVKGTGHFASGPISFLQVFDAATDTIVQGGKRRGANLGSLDVDHPDIIEFIQCKAKEGTLKNFNLSVNISDSFMQGLDNPHNAKIFKMIVEGNYQNGEPGIIFSDAAERDNKCPHLGKLDNTNPCLHEDTLMFTSNGLERISSSDRLPIWNGSFYSLCKCWYTGTKPTIKVSTKSGFEWVTTHDHKFMLEDGSWCEACDLMDKKIKFEVANHVWEGRDPYPECNYEILGFEFGNGSYHKASGRMKYVYVTPDKDQEVVDIFQHVFGFNLYIDSSGKVLHIPIVSPYADAFVGTLPERMIPDWIMTLPKEQMRAFLRGLFSANGCNLQKYNKIQLVSSNKEMLQQVQQMLLLFGIKGKLWWHNKETTQTFSNGDYVCKQSWHIVISKASYGIFLDTIGFIQSYKNVRGTKKFSLSEYPYEAVCDIVEYGEARVWDFEEPREHYGISSGAYVHNCSETRLFSWESCNLASINLVKCIGQRGIDTDKLERVIRTGVRMLNRMIDLNDYPLPQIREATLKTRKIGLGVMGFADALILLGYRYGEGASIDFAKSLFSFVRQHADQESTCLAKKYGLYPESRGDPRRNAAVLSIAPTGSISLFPNVSSGIEPNFAWVYNRSTWATGTKKTYRLVHPLIDQFFKGTPNYDEIVEYAWTHGTLNGCEHVPEDLAHVMVVATDITPTLHVRMQAVIQNHGVDQAISKTINCPNNTTREEIADIITLAWKAGCKGLTIYRDKSRNDVVVSRDDVKIAPRNRDQILDGKTYKYKSGCGTIYLTVNTNTAGEVIEILANNNNGGCKASIEAMCRMASISLRSGLSIHEIIRQLKQVDCKKSNGNTDGKSCADIIGKCLARYVTSTISEANTGPVCPKCGAPILAHDGCRQCTECSWSKCD